MAQNIIAMSAQEISKYDIIREVLNGKINGTQAATQLSLTTRHIRRLKKIVEKQGAKGLVHGNRGKLSSRKTSRKTIKKAVQYLKKHYADFKPTFASEKLKERHGIVLGREKVRQIMIGQKLCKVKAKAKTRKYRTWRPRKEYYGQMQQFDGSYHLWFEDRGEECCLLASIDDATSKITQAQFEEQKLQRVMQIWEERGKQFDDVGQKTVRDIFTSQPQGEESN